MSSYSFSDDAVQDLDDICEYIARNNYGAASKLFDRIRERCKVAGDFPNMGKNYSQLSPSLRGFIVDDYIIFYYPREDGIDVVRVVSGYRDLESLFWIRMKDRAIAFSEELAEDVAILLTGERHE